MKKWIALLLAAMLTLGMAATALAEYPTAPIMVVVPYGAGGGTDLFARVMNDKMSQIIGGSIQTTNVTGGGGTNGATAVAVDAPKDGYTLGFCIYAPLVLMPMYGQTKYTLDDIEPICGAYSTLNVLAVAADSPYKTVEDIIDLIKSKNGSMPYGGSGTGNNQHLTMEEWFQQLGGEGWKMRCVAYTDGDAAEAVALISHEVEFAIMQAQGVKSYVEDGTLRVLMVFGDECPAWMTEANLGIPTSAEKGYKCSIVPIVGYWGPKGISQEVVDVISNAFKEAMEDEATAAAVKNLGLEFDYRPAEEYKQVLNDLAPVAEGLLKQLGLI